MCMCATVSVCCIHVCVCVCVCDCFWPFSHSQWIVFFSTTVLCFYFHVNCSGPMCFSGEVAHDRITLFLYQDTDYWKESVYMYTILYKIWALQVMLLVCEGEEEEAFTESAHSLHALLQLPATQSCCRKPWHWWVDIRVLLGFLSCFGAVSLYTIFIFIPSGTDHFWRA